MYYAEGVHFLHFWHKIQPSMHQYSPRCIQQFPYVLIVLMTHIYGNSHGIFTSRSPPTQKTRIEPLLSVASPFFCIRTLQIQNTNKISISSENPPHTLLFRFKEISFFRRQTHFLPTLEHPLLPPPPMQFRQARWSSLNGVRASAALFIRDFIF